MIFSVLLEVLETCIRHVSKLELERGIGRASAMVDVDQAR